MVAVNVNKHVAQLTSKVLTNPDSAQVRTVTTASSILNPLVSENTNFLLCHLKIRLKTKDKAVFFKNEVNQVSRSQPAFFSLFLK